MKTRKFMMVALAMLCAMTATTLFSSCGDDKDDTPQYAMYSISNYLQDIKIAGQTMEDRLAMYQLYQLGQQADKSSAEEKLAYMMNLKLVEVESQINKTGGVPVNVSERDKQVISWYDIALEPFQNEVYKGAIKGQIKIYRSTNGSNMETIKVYNFE